MLKRERSAAARTRLAARPVPTRRAALRVAALVLILVSVSVSALGAGSRVASSRHAAGRPRHAAIVYLPHPPAYGGEPNLAQRSGAPGPVWKAAFRFVRDYEVWSSGRLATLPAGDAAGRVVALLERRGRAAGAQPSGLAQSLRLAPDGRRGYIATSRVGNFLIGKRGSRWLVMSLPGD